jgi:hypothetical protein
MLAVPNVVPGSECAASKRNDFVNSHIPENCLSSKFAPPGLILQFILFLEVDGEPASKAFIHPC